MAINQHYMLTLEVFSEDIPRTVLWYNYETMWP